MKQLYIYISIQGKDTLVGTLTSSFAKGQELFSFAFDDGYLNNLDYPMIDPLLYLFPGTQYEFGFLRDMTPDRFGTMLIERYEQTNAARENRPPKKLTLMDLLERTNDLSRMGALRIKKEMNGPFINEDESAIPPYIYLNDIEYASIALEEGGEADNELLQKLLLPGSSLGGARPKASVYYQDEIYLAKFPSKKDRYDVELWEYIINRLAAQVGIEVPDARLEKYSDYGHTLLLKRFDRDGNQRIHYLSGVTALGTQDGKSGSHTYLDLANFINSNCVNISANLRELYKRIVFTYLINNTDNHLRNHAFLFSGAGYQLAPMYDVNPSFFAADFELPFGFGNTKDGLLEIASYFYVDETEAKTMIASMTKEIREQLIAYAAKYPVIKKETSILLGLMEEKQQ